MDLSPHFTLEEMVVSQTAARLGLNNTPPPEIVDELKRTAVLLEEVRGILGAPILISSGYRAPAVNRAVGGVADSAHLFGRAADFICPAVGTPLIVAIKINGIPGLVFDQLIHEFGSWVHLAVARPDGEPRRQVLTIDGNGTRSGL